MKIGCLLLLLAMSLVCCSSKEPSVPPTASIPCVLEKQLQWQNQRGTLCLRLLAFVRPTSSIPTPGLLLYLDLVQADGNQTSRIWQEFRDLYMGQLQPRDFQLDVDENGKGTVGFAIWNSVDVFAFDLSTPVDPLEHRKPRPAETGTVSLAPREEKLPYHVIVTQFLDQEERRLYVGDPVRLISLKQDGYGLIVVTRIGAYDRMKEITFRRSSAGRWSREKSKSKN